MVQSASEVPSEIMNNFNSRVILKHEAPDQLKTALPGATPEQLSRAPNLAPGEAFVKLFGSVTVMHCQFRRSPFKLTKLGEDADQ
jgi:hypothetical protein